MFSDKVVFDKKNLYEKVTGTEIPKMQVPNPKFPINVICMVMRHYEHCMSCVVLL